MLIFTTLLLSATQQCDDFVKRGYCHEKKYETYMSRHCPDACGAQPEAQEDEACGNWASEGYCTHEQFKKFMESSCPRACGFPVPAPGATPTEEEPAAEEEEEPVVSEDEPMDEEEPEEEDAPAPSAPGWRAAAGSGAAAASGASAAGEPENCAGWARQGLCDAGSAHAEYMKQNCAATCANIPAGGGSGGGEAADPITCTRWAMLGYCEDDHTHATFMRQSCAEQCEKAKLLKDAKPPPFDIFTILLIGAFGAGVLYAVKYAIQRDGALSGDVRQKTLGEKKGVGPGKQNKSAFGAQKRSAKKTN